MSVNIAPLTPAEIATWFGPPGPAPDNTFEIALVLGGTVSAGAFTAGALDFLIQALDAWSDAKAAGQAVPRHDAVIKVIAGTSGGGVNAAIAARALAYDFPHVSLATPVADAAGNPFYDTWINRLTLAGMLGTGDLPDGATAVSLLDGQVLDQGAARLIAFATPSLKPRPYLAAPLQMILTLTNLNGIAYRISFDGGNGDLGESYVDHADYARFALSYPGQAASTLRPDAFPLGFDPAAPGDWASFGQYALGTAAFPIGFPPRSLSRPLEHYRYRVVAVPGDTDPNALTYLPLVPDWAAIQDWAGGGLPDTYHFRAVDGGAADNEPIELARTALAGIAGRNPRDGMKATRGVVLIDPFAGAAPMAPPISQTLPDLAAALVTAMVQQTRYDTRDLLLAAHDDVYSRFLLTAVRGAAVGDAALATAGLGAFIGFASDAFRRHDYLLGRKNCQDFLRSQFVLPQASPVFAGPAMAGVNAADYLVSDSSGTYLPIIPLVGAARVPVATADWPAGALTPSDYRDAIDARFTRLLQAEFATGPLSSILAWLAAKAGEATVADAVITAMQTALTQAKLA